MSLEKLIYWSSKNSNRMRDFYRGLAFHMEAILLSGYRKDAETINLIKKVRKESHLLVTAGEAFLVYSLAQAQRDCPGDMAEVGVYRGGTAKLICEAKGPVPLHLFDTFQGLPRPDERDECFFQPGWYAGRLEFVRDYLKSYKDVFFYPGLFPDTAAPVADKTFSFVHLDVDLYQGTTSCLEFFYPRVERGGIMLVHDYQLPGVKKAVTDFFASRPDRAVELCNTQYMVVKL